LSKKQKWKPSDAARLVM